jgi:hypothetical protein
VSTSAKLLDTINQEGIIELVTDGPRLRLIFLESGVFRIRVSWEKQFPLGRSYSLVKTA